MKPRDTATVDLNVPPEAEGERLDRFLVARIAGPTRAAVRRWILDGRVTVGETAASKPGLTLRPGMRITVEVPEPPAVRPEPEALAFEILHREASFVVVNKPAGVTVHPGHGTRSGTLVGGLLERGIALAPTGAPDRPGIVHRLDRDTSGLLVVACDDAAYRALSDAFARRVVRKRYRALVWGRPEPAADVIERPIGRSRANPTRMAVSALRGRARPALTRYRTLETPPGFALLEVEIETGRTHQIRVHFESIHHPVVGDERYGGRAWRGLQDPRKRKAVREFDRLALHATDLTFPHPTDGRSMSFHAPPPAQFESLLACLREKRP